MAIVYALEPDLSAIAFREVLIASTLGERRPVSDLARLERMLRQADIIVTARDGTGVLSAYRARSAISLIAATSRISPSMPPINARASASG